MSNNKPIYKGREFYYKNDNIKEDYHYVRNQPLGSKPLELTVEHFVQRVQKQETKKQENTRNYPGVL